MTGVGGRGRTGPVAAAALLLALLGPVPGGSLEAQVRPPPEPPPTGSRFSPLLGLALEDASHGGLLVGIQWSRVTRRFELPAVRADAFFSADEVRGAAELRVHRILADFLYLGAGAGVEGTALDETDGVEPAAAVGVMDRDRGFRMELALLGVEDPRIAFTWAAFWF